MTSTLLAINARTEARATIALEIVEGLAQHRGVDRAEVHAWLDERPQHWDLVAGHLGQPVTRRTRRAIAVLHDLLAVETAAEATS